MNGRRLALLGSTLFAVGAALSWRVKPTLQDSWALDGLDRAMGILATLYGVFVSFPLFIGQGLIFKDLSNPVYTTISGAELSLFTLLDLGLAIFIAYWSLVLVSIVVHYIGNPASQGVSRRRLAALATTLILAPSLGWHGGLTFQAIQATNYCMKLAAYVTSHYEPGNYPDPLPESDIDALGLKSPRLAAPDCHYRGYGHQRFYLGYGWHHMGPFVDTIYRQYEFPKDKWVGPFFSEGIPSPYG